MATVRPQIPPCSSPVTSSQPLPPHTMTVPTYQPFKGAEEDEEDSQSESEGEDDDEDEEEEEEEEANIPEINSALFVAAPSIEEARVALKDLGLLLRPPRHNRPGCKDPKLDLLFRRRLERMQVFLRKYTDPSNGPNGWMAASFQAAKDFGGGTSQAKRMREWTRDYIADRECLPINLYGSWNTSIIEDEDFASELLLHLQGI